MARQIALLSAILIVLLAVFVFAERTFSSSFQQCIGSQENNEKEPSVFGITVDNYVRCTGDFVKTYEAAIGALATIMIAAFTGTLWIATSRQAQLTREAFVADKRAFVFASGIQPHDEPDVATGHFNWRLGPIWQNSGDTPTQGLQIYTDGFLSNVPISPTFDFNYIDPVAPPGPGMLGLGWTPVLSRSASGRCRRKRLRVSRGRRHRSTTPSANADYSSTIGAASCSRISEP